MRQTLLRMATCVACLCVFVLFPHHAAHAADPLTAAHYEFALKRFLSAVDETYPYFDLKGIRADWEACKKELLQKVKTCRSRGAFYALIFEAGRRLRVTDFTLVDSAGKSRYPELPYYPGVTFLPAVNGKVVVASMLPEEEYEYGHTLRPGSIVLTIDGENARQFLERAATGMWEAGGWFSSPQRARALAYHVPFHGRKGARHRLTVLTDGQRDTVKLRNKHQVKTWQMHHRASVDLLPDGLKEKDGWFYGTLESGFGYMYLRKLERGGLERFDKALAELADTRGLILDLRGDYVAQADMVKRLDKRNGPTKGLPYFGGELVVLIDAGTAGVCEVLVRDLVLRADAHLIGSRSGGAYSVYDTFWHFPYRLGGAALPTSPPDACKQVGLDGQPIEYNGIAPHVTVEVVPEELARGIDSAIARAEEYLTEKTGQPPGR